MSSDPVVVRNSASVPNKKQDDFDMAKLQKALKQDQRRSLVSKNKVAKLTPAEIRSLNHSVGLSKSSSVRSVDNRSIHRFASTTPPLTPDHHSSSRRSHSQRRSSADLPTPPLSPDRDRRGSTSSTRYIHAPKPLSHVQALHLTNATGQSRPSSQSSYRGVATYRGNEITRNNSLTMIQHPSQQIVSNPLSQFSRPRQSTITSTTSPSKSSPEQLPSDDKVIPIVVKERTRSEGTVGRISARQHSPVRKSDSPVSMEDGTVDREATERQPADGVPVVHVTPKPDDDSKKDEQTDPLAKQKLNWRRTFTGSAEQDPDIAPLRKEFRRRTLLSPRNGYCLHAIHYNDTKPGQPPQLRDSLKDELPSAKTSIFKDDELKQAALETEFGQHPAVRPLSQDMQRSLANESESSSSRSSNQKGKEREIDVPYPADSDTLSLVSSVPSYSRCSCCGRIQKPGGFESDLSPVMENENLRTNFNFEIEKMSGALRPRSNSIATDGHRKYTPIIPMEIGNETKQARIEPMKEAKPPAPEPAPVLRGVAINKPGDIIGPSSMPLAIMPRRKIDPRVVRFASLHRTKEDKVEEEPSEEMTPPPQNLMAPPQIQRFGSLYGLRNESQRQQQQQEQSRDQNTTSVQPSSQSAYQAQQARQQQQNIGNHPLRMSHNAYQSAIPQPREQNPTAARPSTPTEPRALEKPLGDSPEVERMNHPQSPETTFSVEDGEAVVDLSSFDGSFGGYQPASESATGPTMSTSSSSTKSNSASNASINDASIHQASTASYTVSNRAEPPPLNTNLSNSSAKTAIFRPNSTTIVRMIPSDPISVTSSPTSTKGPLKLGDWVLPDTPSTMSSRKGSIQSESMSIKRGIAAA